MPNVPLERDMLFQSLGKTFTDKEFDELCFEFGIELDEVVTETRMKRKQDGHEEKKVVVYKIDVPANRQDLLCMEGLSRALRIFMGTEEVPVWFVLFGQE
jgi:phenylalanyl-tRNA synthetase, beta subunit